MKRFLLTLVMISCVTPIISEAAITFQTVVFFALGSSSLSDNARIQVGLAMDNISDQKTALILAYADSTGGASYNIKISSRRAAVVSEALVAGGVDRAKIQLFGCGIAARNGDSAWKRRRAELLIVDNAIAAETLGSYCRSVSLKR